MALNKVRLFGDLVVAAFFEGEKSPRNERAQRRLYANAVVSGETERYRSWLEEWQHAEQPLAPFHWEIEFLEVFERESPGFDAIVGQSAVSWVGHGFPAQRFGRLSTVDWLASRSS